MKISRKLAIAILKYLDKNPRFYFPFLVMCQEYGPEDDDFVEICYNEWQLIEEDESYKTFELWENLQDLREDTTQLLAKWFIEKIIWEDLESEIKAQIKWYKKLYKVKLTESEKIEEYWENEFFGWKKEAYEDILDLYKKYKI
ncbi:MAG: hypothetical protein ACD_49C00050G0034 [uncultured bacterium (gcode 4)]|uniref:Uncharacterized protein n=1 Tax=uncultured bacterium (gcode 4) TaxID=1234023 RepID=K2BVS7_9BACT|nr:MAG: hypothetical protein ACD_49C00050G0034 [uncultured bacterium (gcode 4)]